jgi:beta-mannanase
MKRLRTLWPLGLLAGFATGLPFWISHRHLPFFTGAYRYPPVAESLPNSSIETAFVSWVDPDAPGQIQQLLGRAKRRRSLALVNLEPFADPSKADADRTLVKDTVQGTYQPRLNKILKALCKPDQPVLLRFAHEMDHTGQYPWAVQRGEDYVRLYRAVWAQAQKPDCQRVHWVWSPSGNGDARPFWPGADAVDLIGVSVYTSPRWQDNGRLRSFAEVYEERRWLHQHFQKPLLVAEMGVSGTALQQRRWLASARAVLTRYPELIGWVYFSAPQPNWIPLKTGHENWSLSPADLSLVSSFQPSNALHCQFLHAFTPSLHQKLCPLRPPASA